MSIPRVDPNFTAEDLREAADKFIEAGYEYWEACHKSGLVGGAVIWCTNHEQIVIFSRGEHRATLLQNIHKLGDSIYEFGGLGDE